MKNIFTLIIISLSAIAGNAHIDPETWDHKGINFYKAKVTDLEYSIYNFIEKKEIKKTSLKEHKKRQKRNWELSHKIGDIESMIESPDSVFIEKEVKEKYKNHTQKELKKEVENLQLERAEIYTNRTRIKMTVQVTEPLRGNVKAGTTFTHYFFWSNSMCPPVKQGLKKGEIRIWMSFKNTDDNTDFYKAMMKEDEQKIETYFRNKKTITKDRN